VSKTLIIAGALGVVGRSVLDHFERQSECEIIALSRRPPDFATRARFISADLSDAAATRASLAGVSDVTHAVYCALHGRSSSNDTWGEAEEIDANRRMLENFLDAVEAASPRLSHLAILQGAKAYGCHLGPVSLPGKEAAARHPHPNFYWQQEDLVRERQARAGWAWTIFRPQYIVGFSIGSPINILSPIGVYAAISRELGLPLSYPGRTATPTEATDARLLARAVDWSQGAESAANQIFNITNGDLFTFPDVFAAAALCFGVDAGPPKAASLKVLMSDREEVWARIVRKYELRPYTLAQLVGPSWQFADAAFSSSAPFFESTIKIRKAGFADCIDSIDMFGEWFAELQARRVLPPAP
jgi:nucleoside-diphosphate-sugar epimerase